MNESLVEQAKRVYGRSDSELFAGEADLMAQRDQACHTDVRAFDLRPEESALIVIDMQNDFVAEHSTLWQPEALRQVPRIKRLLDACRELKMPVFFTQQTLASDCCHLYYRFFPSIADVGLKAGTAGADIYPEIYPQPGERRIEKHTYDAFTGTALEYYLKDQRIRTVIICGTQTNRCCEATARRAWSLQYQVVFGSDVCATDHPMLHEATLMNMRAGYARVMTHDEIIVELRAAAAERAAATGVPVTA